MAEPVRTASEQSKRSTREAILDAAFAILARDGYGALTARSVAQEAGTNLALVNYYFGGKKGLLLALYEKLERERRERQLALYADDGRPLSAKWRQAVEYYRQDLADGFVRVHHELQAQGYSDDRLAEPARRRATSWFELLAEAAERYLPPLGVEVPPRDVVIALGAFWYGMEQHHLIGVPEGDLPYFDLLGRIGAWLEEREAAAGLGEGTRPGAGEGARAEPDEAGDAGVGRGRRR